MLSNTLRCVADQNFRSRCGFTSASEISLLESGTEPYSVALSEPRLQLSCTRYGDLPPDASTGEVVSVARRVMLSRVSGKWFRKLARRYRRYPDDDFARRGW
jgi:hypothetical protein